MQPSSPEGYPDLQSTYQYGDDEYGGNKIPSSVAFWFTDSLVVERNAFRSLGGNGPALEAGSRHARISGNTMADISGNGLHIGNITANPDDRRERVEDVTVDNNSVPRIGQDYHGASGIFVGYVAETRILNNEISEVPYTGISVGWGWGRASIMKNNEVAFNHSHNHMNALVNGGGVYTLGAQPGTRIHHNDVRDQAHEYGGLYPDQGSSYLRMDSNVVQGANQWIFMSNGDMNGNTIVGNYSDTRTAVMVGVDCQVDPNHVVSDGQWPSEALDIIAGSGLEMRFREGSHPTGVFSSPRGQAKETRSIPKPESAPFKNAPHGGMWRWVAPARDRNLLGAAMDR